MVQLFTAKTASQGKLATLSCTRQLVLMNFQFNQICCIYTVYRVISHLNDHIFGCGWVSTVVSVFY